MRNFRCEEGAGAAPKRARGGRKVKKEGGRGRGRTDGLRADGRSIVPDDFVEAD